MERKHNTTYAFILFVLTLNANAQLALTTFGISPGFITTSNSSNYQIIANLGATWVRIAQPEWPWGPNVGNWSDWEAQLQAAKAVGLKVLAVCLGTTSAVNGGHDIAVEGDKWPPLLQYVDQYGAFCAEFAKRGADAVEIWVSPNVIDFWQSGVNESAIQLFGAMIVESFLAIKAVTANCLVITGGLAPYGDLVNTNDSTIPFQAPLNYLQKLLAVPNVTSSFDGLGWHPFCFPDCDPLTSSATWNSFRQMTTAYQYLSDVGRSDASIWATAFGSPSSSQGMTELSQATLLSRYLAGFDNYSTSIPLGPHFVYKLKDTPNSDSPDYGLVRVDDSEKPAMHVLRSWIATKLLPPPTNSGCASPAPQLANGTCQNGVWILTGDAVIETGNTIPFNISGPTVVNGNLSITDNDTVTQIYVIDTDTAVLNITGNAQLQGTVILHLGSIAAVNGSIVRIVHVGGNVSSIFDSVIVTTSLQCKRYEGTLDSSQGQVTVLLHRYNSCFRLPWWAILLIVVAAVALAGIAVTILVVICSKPLPGKGRVRTLKDMYDVDTI